jgi:tetratricopeptide (TPR) repeat protein
MRGWIAVAMATMCWSAAADADTKAADAANARGLALHKKKKYVEAAAEYKKALAEDPSHLLAHYNLACVGSLSKDEATAKENLRWLADRSAWDTAADKIMKKATKDADLVWLRKLDMEGNELAGGLKNTTVGTWDLVNKDDKSRDKGKATTDAKLLDALAKAPGKHDQACSADTFATKGDFPKGSTVTASMRDGLALVDDKGAVVARTEPFGCTNNREKVHALNQANESFESVSRLFLVQYANRTEMKVAIFALVEDKRFERVFDAELMGFEGTGSLLQTTMLNKLVFTPAGKDKPIVYRWDEMSTKYVPEAP